MNDLIDIIYAVALQAIEAEYGEPGFPIPAGADTEKVIQIDNDAGFTPANDSYWFSFKVRTDSKEPIGFGGAGNNLYQQNAAFIVECNGPIGDEMDGLREMAQVIINTFEGQHFSRMTFTEATPYEEDISEDASWANITVEAQFYFDVES